MNVGFTGTRKGMTDKQFDSVVDLLQDIVLQLALAGEEMIAGSGDCVGADAQFHSLVKQLGFYTIGHIPKQDWNRAFCEYDEERDPLDYIARDRVIAAECDVLIGTPDTAYRKKNSGTWTTIEFGDSFGRRVAIVLPDGEVKWLN